LAAAHERSRICANAQGVCDRHHDAVAELFCALVEDGRHGQTAGGHHLLAAAGSGAPSAVAQKSIDDGSVPDQTVRPPARRGSVCLLGRQIRLLRYFMFSGEESV
jgi:hypothetical protein